MIEWSKASGTSIAGQKMYSRLTFGCKSPIPKWRFVFKLHQDPPIIYGCNPLNCGLTNFINISKDIMFSSNHPVHTDTGENRSIEAGTQNWLLNAKDCYCLSHSLGIKTRSQANRIIGFGCQEHNKVTFQFLPRYHFMKL